MMNFNFGIMPMMPFMGMNMCRPCATPTLDYGLWNATAPYNFTTNFGGQVQFNNYPTNYSFCDVIGCQNAANPFYYSNYFLNTFMSMMNNTTSMQQAQLNSRARLTGYAIGTEISVTSAMNATSSSIASLKYQIENALNNSSLNDEQKTYLETLKKAAEELQEKLNKLAEAKQKGEPVENIQAEIRDINSDCIELGKLKDEFLKKLSEAAQSGKQNEKTDNDGDNNKVGNDNDNKVDNSDNNNKVKEKDNSKDELKTKAVIGTDIIGGNVKDNKAKEIADEIYKMVDGIGSGMGFSLENYIKNNINKDNVVEVMLYWNKSYAPLYESDDPNGMPETLLDERLMLGCQLTGQFVQALKERLEMYKDVDTDLYDTARNQLNIADREIHSWWTYEDKTAAAINKAHKAIVELMQKANKTN